METRRVSEEQISVTDSSSFPRLRSGLPKTLNQLPASGGTGHVYGNLISQCGVKSDRILAQSFVTPSESELSVCQLFPNRLSANRLWAGDADPDGWLFKRRNNFGKS